MIKLLLPLVFVFTSLNCFGFTLLIKDYRKGAEQGDAEAQYNLGNFYAYGLGVPEDDAEAIRLYLKSAEQGYAKAQCKLGSAYYYGDGVPQDDAEAIRWYLKAAYQSIPLYSPLK